jgi:hypothetical protein
MRRVFFSGVIALIILEIALVNFKRNGTDVS